MAHTPVKKTAGPAGRLWSQTKAHFEGRFLLFGLGLTAMYGLFLGILWLVSPGRGYHISAMTVYHIFLGRAAGISYGYTAQFNVPTVILTNMVIETFLLALIFPLFVLSCKKLLVIPWLRRFTEPARRGAESHHRLIRKLGIPGLFAFVWFPFWMTGPLVGAIIGYMLGIRHWVNVAVVLTGTYLAIATWAFFLEHLYGRLEELAPYAPVIVFGLIILIGLAGYLLGTREHETDPG